MFIDVSRGVKYNIDDYKNNNNNNNINVVNSKGNNEQNVEDIGKDYENFEIIDMSRGVCTATPGIN